MLLENLVTEETMKLYEKNGIITLHLSVTTGSISSSMGRKVAQVLLKSICKEWKHI